MKIQSNGDTPLKTEFYEKTLNGMDTVYDFILEGYDNYNTPRDYGNGDIINMAEIHTLSLICDHPGICVSDVAKMWNRTLSAASQNINKLHRKKLIEKKKEKGNKKTVHLYATPAGQELSHLHKEYDQKLIQQTANSLLEKYSLEQIDTFLDMIQTGLEIIRKDKESK